MSNLMRIGGYPALSGNATAADVKSGKTFYSTDPSEKLTGTMTTGYWTVTNTGNTAYTTSSIDTGNSKSKTVLLPAGMAVHGTGYSASFTVKIQGSDNNSSWSDVVTHSQGVGGYTNATWNNKTATTSYRYFRVATSVSEAWSWKVTAVIMQLG